MDKKYSNVVYYGLKEFSSFITTLFFLFYFLFFSSALKAQTLAPYNWNNVQIHGGGYITGIIFNQSEPNLIYARTDVGGCYRWDNDNEKWIPLLDHVADWRHWGNVSLASDPVETNRVFVTAGMYGWDAWAGSYVYASPDKGNTWIISDTIKTPEGAPIALGGNDPGRGSGERLQVDPNLNNILYLGSNYNGLFKSTDYGVTWNKVTTFPRDSITFVLLDKSSSAPGNPTQDIYVGTVRNIQNNQKVPMMYKSPDGGNTWIEIPGQPVQIPANQHHGTLSCVPGRAAISGNFIYITYMNSLGPHGDYRLAGSINANLLGGCVYKYNKVSGAWTNITPNPDDQGGYSGISVSSSDPDFILVSTESRWWPGDGLWYSVNGGSSWTQLPMIFGHTKAPWAKVRSPHWISDVQIDPYNSSRAMITTGYGIFLTKNLTSVGNNAETVWRFENEGLEETVPLDLISPPSGPLLISALGDIDGFRHEDLAKSPLAGTHFPNRGTCPSIAYAGKKPSVIARTYNGGGSYSTDGAKSWKAFPFSPGSNGYIAVSADGKTFVWDPSGSTRISYSKNYGVSWTQSNGAPNANVRPVADKVNPEKFYVLRNGDIYYSNDGAVNFSFYDNVLPTESWANRQLVSVLDYEGHLWAAMSWYGLYYSTDGVQSFTNVGNHVQLANNVSLGKAISDSAYPSVFIHKMVNGITGLFRSDDMGANWVKINDDDHVWGNSHRIICADPRVFGRLYIGTEGRGILWGDTGTTAGPTNPSQLVVVTPEEPDPAFTVYPNPTENNFIIDLKNFGDAEVNIEVFTSKGQLVLKFRTREKLIDVNGMDLPAGIYLLRIRSEVMNKTVKVLKH